MSDNLILGNGELWFAPFKAGTQTPEGERYIGHSTAFSLGTSSEKVTHMGSDRGIKVQDRSIQTSVTRSGAFTTDEISPENMAAVLLGSASVLSVSGATITDEEIDGVILGRAYQLGVSDANPAGVVNLTEHSSGVDIIVKVGATAKTAGTDYTVDMVQGYVIPLKTGTIAENADILVSYKTLTSTRNVIVSGNTEVEGALRYRAYNASGDNTNYFMPWAKLTVDGEVQLKSTDTFAEIPFTVEVLKKTGLEGIYANGLAIT